MRGVRARRTPHLPVALGWCCGVAAGRGTWAWAASLVGDGRQRGALAASRGRSRRLPTEPRLVAAAVGGSGRRPSSGRWQRRAAAWPCRHQSSIIHEARAGKEAPRRCRRRLRGAAAALTAVGAPSQRQRTNRAHERHNSGEPLTAPVYALLTSGCPAFGLSLLSLLSSARDGTRGSSVHHGPHSRYIIEDPHARASPLSALPFLLSLCGEREHGHAPRIGGCLDDGVGVGGAPVSVAP